MAVRLEMKDTASLTTLRDAYCRKRGLNPVSVAFTISGGRFIDLEKDTLKSLGADRHSSILMEWKTPLAIIIRGATGASKNSVNGVYLSIGGSGEENDPNYPQTRNGKLVYYCIGDDSKCLWYTEKEWWLVGGTDKMKLSTDSGFAHAQKKLLDLAAPIEDSPAWKIYSGEDRKWVDASSMVVDYDDSVHLTAKLKRLWDHRKKNAEVTTILQTGLASILVYTTRALLSYVGTALLAGAEDVGTALLAGTKDVGTALLAGAEDVGTALLHVELRVVAQDQSEVHFRVKRTTSMLRLKEAYCKRQMMILERVLFFIDGKPVRDGDTPEKLELDDGAAIDMVNKGNATIAHIETTLLESLIAQKLSKVLQEQGFLMEQLEKEHGVTELLGNIRERLEEASTLDQKHDFEARNTLNLVHLMLQALLGQLSASRQSFQTWVVSPSSNCIVLLESFQNPVALGNLGDPDVKTLVLAGLADTFVTTPRQIAEHLGGWIVATHGCIVSTKLIAAEYYKTFPRIAKLIKPKRLEVFAGSFPELFEVAWITSSDQTVGTGAAVKLVSKKWIRNALLKHPKGQREAGVEQDSRVMSHSDFPPFASEPRSRPAAAAAAAAAASKHEDEDDVCPLCTDVMTVGAVGPCNHLVCHVCALRLRKFGKNNCGICRTPMPKITLSTDVNAKYSTRGEFPLKQYNVTCTTRAALQAAGNVLKLSCRVCNETGFRDERALKRHVKTKHALNYCELCLHNVDHFISTEQKLFSDGDLSAHEKSEHRHCGFCDTYFFSNDVLLEHLRHQHEQCTVCESEGKPFVYFANYAELEAHYSTDHFLCTDESCRDQSTNKLYRVFPTEFGLHAHQAEHHGLRSRHAVSNVSKKELRRVQSNADSVEYRTDATDGKAYTLGSFLGVYGGTEEQPPKQWVESRETGTGWSCTACTFINSPTSEACVTCNMITAGAKKAMNVRTASQRSSGGGAAATRASVRHGERSESIMIPEVCAGALIGVRGSVVNTIKESCGLKRISLHKESAEHDGELYREVTMHGSEKVRVLRIPFFSPPLQFFLFFVYC